MSQIKLTYFVARWSAFHGNLRGRKFRLLYRRGGASTGGRMLDTYSQSTTGDFLPVTIASCHQPLKSQEKQPGQGLAKTRFGILRHPDDLPY